MFPALVMSDPIGGLNRLDMGSEGVLLANGILLNSCTPSQWIPECICSVPYLQIVGPAADKQRIPGIDVALAEGDTWQFGGHEMHVFDTPGHTRGASAFVLLSQACKQACFLTKVLFQRTLHSSKKLQTVFSGAQQWRLAQTEMKKYQKAIGNVSWSVRGQHKPLLGSIVLD